MICVVSATRLSRLKFIDSYLARSLSGSFVGRNISYENKRGLSEVYNEAIENASAVFLPHVLTA